MYTPDPGTRDKVPTLFDFTEAHRLPLVAHEWSDSGHRLSIIGPSKWSALQEDLGIMDHAKRYLVDGKFGVKVFRHLSVPRDFR